MAIGAGQSIYGAITASNKARKYKRELQREKQRALNDFNREYYQDLSQRGDMQYLLKNLRETNNDNVNRARKTAVVAGKSGEAALTSKMAASQANAQAIAGIGKLGEQHKQNARNAYNKRMDALSNMYLAQINEQRNQASNAIMNGVTSVVQGAASLADSISAKKAGNSDGKTETTEKEG